MIQLKRQSKRKPGIPKPRFYKLTRAIRPLNVVPMEYFDWEAMEEWMGDDPTALFKQKVCRPED